MTLAQFPDHILNDYVYTTIFNNSVAHSYYLQDQNADKQTEIDCQGISNEPFSIVWNAKLNGKCGQTWTLTSSMRSAIRQQARAVMSRQSTRYSRVDCRSQTCNESQVFKYKPTSRENIYFQKDIISKNQTETSVYVSFLPLF